jgi:hypothetical protein
LRYLKETGLQGFARMIVSVLALALGSPAMAADEDVVILIKGGTFVPSEIPLPAGKKVKLIVRNQDSSTSEFESVDFHREKIVPAGGEITVYVGPLSAGTYEFFDDFHPQDRGHVVVK